MTVACNLELLPMKPYILSIYYVYFLSLDQRVWETLTPGQSNTANDPSECVVMLRALRYRARRQLPTELTGSTY